MHIVNCLINTIKMIQLSQTSEDSFDSKATMSISDEGLSHRPTNVHHLLGGGIVADVMLWRRRNASIGILVGAAAAWILFEKSGYTLLSLIANVLLLLVTILFVWATSAALIGRPPPPLPELELSEETVNAIASSIRSNTNFLIRVANDIALGKHPKLFLKVAVYLWLISRIGSWCDFLTFGYTSLVILLTVPAIYEKYQDTLDRYSSIAYKELRKFYQRLNQDATHFINKIAMKYKHYCKKKKVL